MQLTPLIAIHMTAAIGACLLPGRHLGQLLWGQLGLL